MAIEDRTQIREGMTLTATYKGATHRINVLADHEGNLAYEYQNQIYKTPSAAGRAIMGGIACNGWRFFSIEGAPIGEPEARVLAEVVEGLVAGAEAPAATRRRTKAPVAPERRKRAITKVPNQKGVEEGTTRWWCSGCCASFYAPTETIPAVCPEGHPAYIEEEGE